MKSTSLLASLLVGAMRLCRRIGWPASIARMSDQDLAVYSAGAAAILGGRAWLAWRRGPSWPRVHAAWRAAIGDEALRDRIAGRLHADDRFELIADGPAAFARRAEWIAGARQTIDLAFYYVQADDTGRDLVQALADGVRRGVRVRLLVDAIASWRKSIEVPGTDALLRQAEAAGIQLRRWTDAQRPHDGNHRKMMIVDGQRAVVGGRNIADHYRGTAWRDLDLLLQGPVVTPLAQLYDALWQAPPQAAGGPHSRSPWVDHVPARILDDTPMRFALAAIGAAQGSVELELAYLVAQPPLIDALTAAARRGVAVRVLTNSAESNDLPFIAWTCADALCRLQAEGVPLRLRRGAGCTLHPKYLVVDTRWVSIGSHNLDYHSSRLCGETNLVVDDAPLAAALRSFFDSGWQLATPPADGELQRWHAGAGASRLFDRLFRDYE
ncbi:MAG: phosphatidylserine/phosphatidylglycerophosphate/cardiolipin synthase family protein [Rubrivivax sp.]